MDALLIAVVAGVFVILITSRRKLRGPIPLAVLPRLHEVIEPRGITIEVPRASLAAPRARFDAAMAALRLARARAWSIGQAVANAVLSLALRRRRAIGLALAVAVSAVVWFVWPTQYRTLPLRASGARIGKSFDVVALRQQRVTGRVDALVSGGGWVCVAGC